MTKRNMIYTDTMTHQTLIHVPQSGYLFCTHLKQKNKNEIELKELS